MLRSGRTVRVRPSLKIKIPHTPHDELQEVITKPFGVRTHNFCHVLETLSFRLYCLCSLTDHGMTVCGVLSSANIAWAVEKELVSASETTLDEAALEHCFREMCLMRSSRILTWRSSL